MDGRLSPARPRVRVKLRRRRREEAAVRECNNNNNNNTTTTHNNNYDKQCDSCRASRVVPPGGRCDCDSFSSVSLVDKSDDNNNKFPSDDDARGRLWSCSGDDAFSWQTIGDIFAGSRRRSSDDGVVAVTKVAKCTNITMTVAMIWMLFFAAITNSAQARSAESPRYETAYACEGKTLSIECRNGEVIELIRANYGRFSITICNDRGNTEWSVNCMSNKSIGVLRSRCSMNQNCSVLASTNLFGDPCENTLKYLEAHYRCIPATTSSSTVRPSPPWLITSQPSVWKITVPTSLGAPVGTGNVAASSGNSAEKPRVPPGVHHLAPPTIRPHITMPPDFKIGVIKQGKNDDKDKTVTKAPIDKNAMNPVSIEEDSNLPEQTLNNNSSAVERPHTNEKSGDETPNFTENPKKGIDDLGIIENDKSSPPNSLSPFEQEREHSIIDSDGNKRHHHHNRHEISSPGGAANQPLWRHCPPQTARGLQWNWTSVDEVAVQPCPGGATGLARWRCVSSAHRLSHLQQQRRLGSPNKDSSLSSQGRTPMILDTVGTETFYTGKDVETKSDVTDFRDKIENLMQPEPLASNSDIIAIGNQNNIPYDGQPVWISENPDLSECRSVWLNSLETRVKEGKGLLSVSNELIEVTSSKTLYGGDMMTTTNIIKHLAQKMFVNIQTFPDPHQKEEYATDLLLGVVKTGSNMLDVTQQASWKDLSHLAQMRVATSLLIGLEENAFLLAGAIFRQKTIIQTARNILLSVQILEIENVETEEFPSINARQKWDACKESPCEDAIYLPRGALIDNSEGRLVRIVFVAFDRLQEILQPPPAPVLPIPMFNSMEESSYNMEKLTNTKHQQMNSEKDRDNVTRVINSKVISASLGKGRHIQLSQPVRLTLRHLRTENVTNPTCVFWDYTVNVWSTEGCHVEWTNFTHTGCQCTHLTNFALLMDVHSSPLSAIDALVLSKITLVGCCVSVICLSMALIMFLFVGGIKSDRTTIHKNLCACLLIAEVIFIFGIEQTMNRVVCGVIAALLHYFFLAAFAWMFLEGFQLYVMLIEVFEPERARARWYYFFGYVVPLVIVLISGLVDYKSYGTSQHCWLSTKNYFHMSFIGPAALVILANWFILVLVIYMMCRHSNVSIKTKENSKLHKIKVWLRSSTVLAILLGLTWTFGLLYINQETVVMAYIFTILNSLQGVFIFISLCLQNEMFQKECSKLGRRHQWLSCCLKFAPANPPGPTPATASSSAPTSGAQCPQSSAPIITQSAKHPRYRDHPEDQCLEDVSDRDHSTRYSLKQQESPKSRSNATATRPSLLQSQIDSTTSTPHSLSMPSIHNSHSASNYSSNKASYHQHGGMPNRTGTPVPVDLQQEYASNVVDVDRSRSPSCFSVKMGENNGGGGWGVVQNPLSSAAVSNTWKNTSSKLQQQTLVSTMQHQEHIRRADTLRSCPRYDNDISRTIHAVHSQRHHHANPHSHHSYNESSHYYRGGNQEYRGGREEPEYEEIDRNETLISDMSDDNSGQGERCMHHPDLGIQGGSYNLHGDSRPLISYSPGESHRYDHSPVALDHQIPHGRFNINRWDSLDRHPDRGGYGSYHAREQYNPRTLAAVLNRENNVVCHVEPEALYPGHGHIQRTVLPPYSDC